MIRQSRSRYVQDVGYLCPDNALRPYWDRLGVPYEATPAGRAACFLVCVLSAWSAKRILKALASWEDRLFGAQEESKPAGRADLRAWLTAPAEIYAKAFWVTAAAIGVLTFMGAALADGPALASAITVVVSLTADYFNAALGLIAREIDGLPGVLSAPAALLVLSFLPYAASKVARF